MRKTTGNIAKFAMLSLLCFGALLLIISAFYSSSFLAILGLAMLFWGCILLYIRPSKYIPLSLLNATNEANTRNTELLLSELQFAGKGVYLPPKSLPDVNSSVVFISKSADLVLPQEKDAVQIKLFSDQRDGLFLIPPGVGLLHVFEKELGFPFTRTDVNRLQNILPKILIDKLEIAESIDISIENNTVTFEITGSLFKDNCEETQKFLITQEKIGCILSSSIACAIAKASGKATVILSEEQIAARTTRIKYQLVEV